MSITVDENPPTEGQKREFRAAFGVGGVSWSVLAEEEESVTLQAGQGVIVGNWQEVVLPADFSPGDQVAIHCYDGTAIVNPNGASIVGVAGTVGGGDTLDMNEGESSYLVARTSSEWRLI